MDPHHEDIEQPEPEADEAPAGPTERSHDPEVPEADSLEQEHDVTASPPVAEVSRDLEVPEADAIEQAMEVPGQLEEGERDA